MKRTTEAIIAIATVTVVAAAGWDLFTSDETPSWAVLMGVVLSTACAVEAARRFWIEFPKPTRAPFELTRSSIGLLLVIGCMLVVPVVGLWAEDGDPVIGVVMLGVGAGSLALLIRHLCKPIDLERREPVDPDDWEWERPRPDTTSDVA